MKKSWGLKEKILILLILNLFLIFGLSYSSLSQKWHSQQQALAINESKTYISALAETISSIQKQRGLSVLFLSDKDPNEDYKKQVKISSEKISELTSIMKKISYVDKNIIKETEENLKSYFQITEQVEKKIVNINQALKSFTEVIHQFILCEFKISKLFTYNKLEQNLSSLILLENAKENFGQLRALVNKTLVENKPIDKSTLQKILNLKATGLSNLNPEMLILGEKQFKALSEVTSSKNWEEVLKILNTIENHHEKGSYEIEAAFFFKMISLVMEDVSHIIKREANEISIVAEKFVKSISIEFWLYVFLTLFTTLAIMIISFVVILNVSKRIKKVSDRLSESSHSLLNESLQVSQASNALSTSLDNQASAIQETVASVDEINAMLSKSVDNAESSEKEAITMIEISDQGKKYVEMVVGSIDEITLGNEKIMTQVDKSNLQLEKIVDLINEIASKTNAINDIVFQTKLLSFNASVEAARAGEQGKGFAVVAEEVGNLAQMSGLAAKEISIILENSTSEVRNIIAETKTSISKLMEESKSKLTKGQQVANECFHIFTKISKQIESVSSLVVSISKASKEQSSGVNQITEAMNSLNQLTHKNLIFTQNTTTSSDKLKKEAEQLQQMVTELVFVINGVSN